jgi:hypothetical protein
MVEKPFVQTLQVGNHEYDDPVMIGETDCPIRVNLARQPIITPL